jgi:hypothetical protein
MFKFEGQSEPSDPIEFERLTEALRGGPGSKAWEELDEELRSQTNHAEYRTLLHLRRRLEDARSQRQLQPSERFNEKILAAILAEGQAGLRLRWNGRLVLAAAAALLAISIAGIVVVATLSQPGNTYTIVIPPSQPPEAKWSTRFESSIPAGWETIGTLPARADRGLRLASAQGQAGQFGGVVWTQPLPRDGPYRVELSVRYLGGAGTTPEAFITDANNFTAAQPSGHEISWTMSDDMAHVRLPGGALVADGSVIRPGQAAGLCVYFNVHGSTTSIETACEGHSRTWTGAIALDSAKPWHLGLRLFLRDPAHAQYVNVSLVKLTRK